MWLSFSPDLRHWGDHKILIESPLETEEGWLILYHGVRQTAAGCLYRLGLALLDLEDPARLICRSDSWVFAPETHYERTGDVGSVVFPCGWTLHGKSDLLSIYYGAADTSTCLATASLKDFLGLLKGSSA
jgi:predicted GH43/DUF377 family glycosyl hydrolase